MAWSVPSTAVAGQPFTAVLYNAQIRDNLLATAPALATTISSFFAATGTNAIAERIPLQDNDQGASTTASTSYTSTLADGLLTTVTVASGTAALVMIYCNLNNSGATNNTWLSYAVSGATTSAADDNRAMLRTLTGGERFGAMIYHAGLTPGNNTFTLQYRVTAGTGTYSIRRIGVIPF